MKINIEMESMKIKILNINTDIIKMKSDIIKTLIFSLYGFE